MTTPRYGPGIEITGRVTPEYAEILTPEAIAFAARLQRAFGGRLSCPTPRGGFFLWARLPAPLTADRLLPIAQAHGVIYVAGSAFFVDGTGQEYLRLCFSYASPGRIELGVERLAAAVASATEALEKETLTA